MELNRSPLHGDHIALDAKFAEFGGGEMPISYPASGTLEEHRSCRVECAMFDVSHLGSVRVEGRDAFEELQYAFTNDLGRINHGRAQYSHLLNPNGHVIDDVIIWWIKEDVFEVMPNASNTERVEKALLQREKDLIVENITKARAVIAIQGPMARNILRELSVEASEIERFHVQQIMIHEWPVTIAGTGYTGEDGVEISVQSQNASSLWKILMTLGCTPAGLGARDTLRLEAGLPLHGHELGEGISPLQAGYKWVVSMDKGEFIGRESVVTEIETGQERVLRGLVTTGRRPPRHGNQIVVGGEVVGHVTSGNFSPTLGKGIAMGFVPALLSVGTDVVIQGERSEIPAELVNLPFYPTK